MPSVSFNFVQLNFVCCSRRNRNRDCSVVSETEPATASEPDSFSDFELVHPTNSQRYPRLSRARLRWVRAIFAAILRQKICKAFIQLQKLTKRNKKLGVSDPVASRLWGQTGHWLQRHKL